MIEIIRRIMGSQSNFIDILMAIGIIPFILSLLFGVILALGFSSVIAYIIPALIIFILIVAKLCNPLTMAIGHVLLLLVSLFLPIGRYFAIYYSIYMTVITVLIAVFYYIFCYKEKTVATNIIMTAGVVFIIVIWCVLANIVRK